MRFGDEWKEVANCGLTFASIRLALLLSLVCTFFVQLERLTRGSQRRPSNWLVMIVDAPHCWLLVARLPPTNWTNLLPKLQVSNAQEFAF